MLCVLYCELHCDVNGASLIPAVFMRLGTALAPTRQREDGASSSFLDHSIYEVCAEHP